jgi:hypothetical protein
MTRAKKPENKKASELSSDELRTLLVKKQEEEKKEAEKSQLESKSALEAEFLKVQKESRVLIEKKLIQLNQTLSEAVNVSEKYGIPFEVSAFGYTYTPDSFQEKFDALDRDWLSQNTNIMPDEYPGWQSSSYRC